MARTGEEKLLIVAIVPLNYYIKNKKTMTTVFR